MAAPKGTEIRAAANGTVLLARYGHASYGNYVVVGHGGGVTTLYAHCSALNVTVGQAVSAGDVIAFVGSTGDSTGDHLHLEVKRQWNVEKSKRVSALTQIHLMIRERGRLKSTIELERIKLQQSCRSCILPLPEIVSDEMFEQMQAHPLWDHDVIQKAPPGIAQRAREEYCLLIPRPGMERTACSSRSEEVPVRGHSAYIPGGRLMTLVTPELERALRRCETAAKEGRVAGMRAR